MENYTQIKRKMLIIEDEADIADLYKLRFQKEGFDVKVAENGICAFNIVKQGFFAPDVILLDVMMPGMDGFETVTIMKNEISQDTKIVMLSNIDDKLSINKALEFGVHEYITKIDNTPKEVVNRVMNVLV